MRRPPRAPRRAPWLGALALLCALPLASPFACGTEAVSPDGCRTIENARCEQAASSCPDLGVRDVDSCQRFYRDQCLRGFARADDPGSPAIEACVRAIEGAGECARAGVATAAECGRYQEVQAASPCEVIRFPERVAECAFLAPPPSAGSAGAAGASGGAGAAGSAGDSGGAGGASGTGAAGGAAGGGAGASGGAAPGGGAAGA